MLRLKALRLFSNKVNKIIENEFYNNPEFRRAMPNASSKLPDAPELPREPSYVEGLLYKYKDSPKIEQETTELNEKTFVEGYKSPRGPIKWMSQEDKDRIHAQIDYKMEELERTGLSREEILFNRAKGFPLREDSVFQYLKSNREAREMMLKPGEEFTAEKVIDYALRQDTGTDRSKTLSNERPLYEHELPEGYEYDVRTGKTYPKKIKPEDYYWSEKLDKKYEEYRKYFKGAGAMFPEKIPQKHKLRRRYKRQVNINDIDYRNTEFLSQFMTKAGLIKSRWQTKLSSKAQKKVSKAIKHARNLNLFTTKGFVMPPHKKNLEPMQFQNFSKFVIHAETGTVYAKKYESEVSRQDDLEYYYTIEKTANKFHMENPDEDLAANRERLEKLLDVEPQFIPNQKQLEILEAQYYFKSKEGEGKEAFEKLSQNLSSVEPTDLASVFIKEKGADEELLNLAPQERQEQDILSLWEDLANFKKECGIQTGGTPNWVQELANTPN